MISSVQAPAEYFGQVFFCPYFERRKKMKKVLSSQFFYLRRLVFNQRSPDSVYNVPYTWPLLPNEMLNSWTMLTILPCSACRYCQYQPLWYHRFWGFRCTPVARSADLFFIFLFLDAALQLLINHIYFHQKSDINRVTSILWLKG